jgi:hypothetical protein
MRKLLQERKAAAILLFETALVSTVPKQTGKAVLQVYYNIKEQMYERSDPLDAVFEQ